MFVHSSLRLYSRPTDKLLKAGKLAEMSVGGGAARLTLPHLAKDDEGLYTLRIFTKDGTAEHSAYLFVSGTSLCIMELFNIDDGHLKHKTGNSEPNLDKRKMNLSLHFVETK